MLRYAFTLKVYIKVVLKSNTKIPLNPPFSKGETRLLPFIKGDIEGFIYLTPFIPPAEGGRVGKIRILITGGDGNRYRFCSLAVVYW